MFDNLFIDKLSSNPRIYFSVVITVIVSICIHELAHGIVAIWHGDRTPIETGHMTLNPVVHMGGMSLLMLVMTGISWGAMPVNPSRMRGKFADVWVSAAGPASNVILALIGLVSAALMVRLITYPHTDLVTNTIDFLSLFGEWNVALAIFNLIPVPPLDGSRILAGVSPAYANLLERMVRGGMIGVAFLALFFFSGRYIFEAADKISAVVVEHVLTFHWVWRL